MDDQISSEFAQIAWRTEHGANGPRLRLEDLRTGRVRFPDSSHAIGWPQMDCGSPRSNSRATRAESDTPINRGPAGEDIRE